MKRLMQYTIISGKVIETRRAYLPVRSVGRTRGTRRAGASSARKIAANEKQEALRLGRLLNANFGEGGYLVTLKYDNGRLPGDYEALCENGEKLMRKLRLLCRKEGVAIKRILVNANWSPKRDAPARLHHHVVINEIPLGILKQLWPEGEMDIRTLDKGDLTGLAVYLCKNVKAEGRKKWNPSRGLEKPVVSEPVPVDEIDGIQTPSGASEIYQEPTYDEDGRQIGAYLRCVLPEKPRMRGGQIILPKPRKRGGRRE